MSVGALLQAAVDHLREKLPLEEQKCGVIHEAGGKPPPTFLDYVAVWCHQWSMGPTNESGLELNEIIGFTVTITKASTYIPYDMQPDKLWLEGMEPLSRQILHVLLRDRWDVLCDATQIVRSSRRHLGAGFVSPYNFAGGDPSARPVDAQWFSQDISAGQGDFGHVMDLRFEGAHRMESYAPNVPTVEEIPPVSNIL